MAWKFDVIETNNPVKIIMDEIAHQLLLNCKLKSRIRTENLITIQEENKFLDMCLGISELKIFGD